jgi:glyoxalase family protein
MKLEGIHHITNITGDAPGNLDFYTGTLGLRLVKKSVNQDDPTVYHLFYADEKGSPGADLTFFEYPGAQPGRAGAGMIHTIVWRVASDDALSFWEERLAGAGYETQRDDGRLRFSDFEGLRHELGVFETQDAPLVAAHPEIPFEVALQGFEGVRAYTSDPERSRALLEEALAFEQVGERRWEARGHSRGGWIAYNAAPGERGVQGAGTVHHVAWATPDDDQVKWRERVIHASAQPTPVIDRFWFRSVYFREPSGVLFELATLGPGFGVDEDPEHLGEALILPPAFEHLRERIEPLLTPLPSPRAGWARR